MRIKTITCQQVKNRGNYESERLEMTAELEEGENAYEVAQKLRQEINSILNAHLKEPKPIENLF